MSCAIAVAATDMIKCKWQTPFVESFQTLPWLKFAKQEHMNTWYMLRLFLVYSKSDSIKDHAWSNINATFIDSVSTTS
jgi:hypothetical protein